MAIGNKYLYALVDFSYVLSRNMFSVSAGKKPGEYNEGDLIRCTIQTMNKMARDYGITADKIVFLADKWDSNYSGYIRHHILKDHVPYKGSRSWMTEEKLENMRSDPNTTPEEIEKAEKELYQNQVKSRAKRAMMADFKQIGMPVLYVDGYEADDLAWISSCMLYGVGEKKSVFITKDSDWQSFTSPVDENGRGGFDFFKLPTGGSQPQIITFEDKYKEIPEVLRNMGVTLYQYNAFMNSLGFSHNDNIKTIIPDADPTLAIIRVLHGDYSDIMNVPAFKAQMDSFDVTKFPKFDEAKALVSEHFSRDGHLGTVEDFHQFCNKYGVSGVSDKYYSDFIGRFDQKLYSE